ncbi:hypothetical protein Tco_1270891 [Tanacetum coccineum]
MVEDVERLRQLLTPTVQALPKSKLVVQPYVLQIPFLNEVKVSKVMQPFTSQTIYTTPPDDAIVVSDTKPILDELLKEFRDKLLNIPMVDKEVDCNPITDIKDLLCIVKTNVELESFIQQLNPVHRVATQGKRRMKSP